MTIHSFCKYCDKLSAVHLEIQRQIWHGTFPIGLLCREEQPGLKYIISTTVTSVILQVCRVGTETEMVSTFSLRLAGASYLSTNTHPVRRIPGFCEHGGIIE